VIDDLLQTKLFIPPLRPSLVPRTRLIEQLNQGKQGKLTLVSAPAGFGKTTLVVAWLRSGETASQTCWLSLDENDNGLSRFFTYVMAALRTIEPEFGQGLLASLQSAQPANMMAIVQTLLNDLAQNGRAFSLVLDDYHVITNTAVHDGRSRFLNSQSK
jgi:LuxR family maltose regulon positive regulatory protein